MMTYACNPRYVGGRDKGLVVQSQSREKILVGPCFKEQAVSGGSCQVCGRPRKEACCPRPAKMARGMAHEVECLPTSTRP